MEKLKLNLNKYKKKKDKKLCATLWQEIARNCVKDYDIKFPQNQRIFKLAKKNLQYLQAQIETVRSRQEWENSKIEEKNKWTQNKQKLKTKKDYTGLLIYLLKK